MRVPDSTDHDLLHKVNNDMYNSCMSVDSSDPKLLNVRETARLLGVHENTIRNWVRDGVLPSAKVPGSRFHRFDARDVERLHQQRGAPVASVEQERRTIGPELVNAAQLAQWPTTSSRDAQGAFPELIRRLLAATDGITNISIRAGDGVNAPGWDGRAQAAEVKYLPDGFLRFEFGVGANPKKKADEEFEKRRDKPEGAVLSELVFVFVTPRRWGNAGAWADRRRAEKVFADVRVLDADDLEGWLQATPTVHYWISERLGRRPRDAETLEQWWERFQSRTLPPLPPALFLTGRDAERDKLLEFLAQPTGGLIAVQADWQDEAIAFACAAIESAEKGQKTQAGLIVSSAEVWDRTASRPGRMILVPLFENPDVASAQKNNHHVVLPLGRDQIAVGAKLALPRPNRVGAAEALKVAYDDADRSADTYELAALARRSMPSLIRKLARDIRLVHPGWAEMPDVAVFAPLTLVGSWSPSDADKEIVHRLVDKPYSDIERTLLHWRETDDPPFVQPSAQWHLACSEEAYLILRKKLNQADLKRWRDIAVEVLTETDPVLNLPANERPMAGFRKVSCNFSPVLRKGIAEGIAMVGSIEAELDLSDGNSGIDHARYVVREILSRASSDTSGQLWQSLTDVLPLLAEAAPNVFLDAVHEDLDQDTPVLTTMFQDKETSGFGSSSAHSGLLWALETVSWSEDFLLDATRALARLQVIDPGGRLANRPSASLQSILVPWIRHTAAPLKSKVDAIESVCRETPDVGWDLVLGLWPSQDGFAIPPSSPRYRDWSPEGRGVPMAEWIEYIGHLVRLAIGLAGENPERWAQLSEHLGPLPPADRDHVLEALETFADPECLDSKQRLLLWERMHNEISRHRQFASADWSMDDAVLTRMEAIADRLEPKDSPERFAYLFDWHPDLRDVDMRDYEAYQEKLLELRKQAVSQALAASSINGLRDLAERSTALGSLGWIAGMVTSEDLTPELLTWLDAEDSNRQEVAFTWASQKLSRHGVQWLKDVLARPQMGVAERRIRLALSAPAISDVWDTLAETDKSLNDTYWERMSPPMVPPMDVTRAAHELLAHDRPWTAVDLLAGSLHRPADEPTSMTAEVVREVLTAALSANPENARTQSLGYELGVLLDYLERDGTPEQALAQYEFAFFQLLDHHRTPRALYAALASNPSQFVDLASRVFRGKNEPERKFNEQETALAHQAWRVLRNWRQLPGRGEDAIDAKHLKQWVDDARLEFAETNRADIGDELIGQVLSASPDGADGLWPAEPVREIIETIGSQDLESGIHTGVINARGFTSRGIFDGGKLEWDLATRYRELSKQTASRWRRTSRVLRRLAEDYERQARQNDAEAAVRADTQ
jgi:excisionase family DNA binding protein